MLAKQPSRSIEEETMTEEQRICPSVTTPGGLIRLTMQLAIVAGGARLRDEVEPFIEGSSAASSRFTKKGTIHAWITKARIRFFFLCSV